jgi:hypothetical protein
VRAAMSPDERRKHKQQQRKEAAKAKKREEEAAKKEATAAAETAAAKDKAGKKPVTSKRLVEMCASAVCVSFPAVTPRNSSHPAQLLGIFCNHAFGARSVAWP